MIKLLFTSQQWCTRWDSSFCVISSRAILFAFVPWNGRRTYIGFKKVAYTAEPLSLFFLLFISPLVFKWRCNIDKLGIFHANQTSICFNPHLKLGWGWYHKTSLSPPVKCFYWPFQDGAFLWIIFVIYVPCLSCFLVCALKTCGHLLGKGYPLGSLVCDAFLCFSHFPMWCSWSGVVLDCIDSWPVSSYLLLKYIQ